MHVLIVLEHFHTSLQNINFATHIPPCRLDEFNNRSFVRVDYNKLHGQMVLKCVFLSPILCSTMSTLQFCDTHSAIINRNSLKNFEPHLVQAKIHGQFFFSSVIPFSYRFLKDFLFPESTKCWNQQHSKRKILQTSVLRVSK